MISFITKTISLHLAMTDICVTGRKSLNYLAPGFFSIGVIVGSFHECGIE